jgi:RNA polymerase sigma factor (sigma-70 family)
MELHRQTDKSNSSDRLIVDGSDRFTDKDEYLVWEKFTKGDDQSLIYIYRKYADVLYRYGRQFTSRSEFLKDCIQELFYELIDKRANLSMANSIKGYLFTALKRKIFRELKKEERIQFEQDGFAFDLSDTALSLNEGLDEKELSIIRTKLNQIPVQQREAILLYFYEGLSYTEIAEILDIKVRSARVLTYRALESLQKELAPYRKSFYLVLLHFTQI